ncbi:MAG: cohesin domain-containing protein [Candidatus Paceibacterales bacterium]
MNTKRTQNLGIKQTRNFWFSVGLVLLFSVSLVQPALADGASLYLSPTSGTFFVGSTFDVSIFVNTGGEDVNAVEVNLKFDPKKLQVASPTTGKSFIEVWIAQPTYSNTKGTMSFMGGVPTPGINTTAGLVSTVAFRAISPGVTSVLFLDSSKVLRNDPQGTNILTSLGRGVYTLLIPPPEGPKVFSPTHPDQNKWYKNNNPTFSWEKEEGVTDFSYSFDQDIAGAPDNISEGDHTSISYSEVEDGMWYFHVKAKKAGVWGGISHYLVRIDTTSPALFTPTVEPSLKTIERQPLISFMTTDALSGLDHYQLKYIDITPEKKEEEVGFFTEVSSPHKLPSLEIGKYLVVVRAYDVAGNWREGTVKIQIFPEGIFFSREGIHYREFLVPWWIIILIILIILTLISFYYWRRQRDLLRKRKGKFNEIERKLENHHREMINGIGKTKF